MKKLFLIAAVLILIICAAIYIYRYSILQYSAEKIIRKLLPDYVEIERMKFDFRAGRITINGFKIINPKGYSQRYLMEIGSLTCNYKMKGRNLLDGVEILEPVFKNCLLNIERLGDGRLDLREFQSLINAKTPAPKNTESAAGPGSESAAPNKAVSARLPGVIKLPEKFLLKGGKIIFIDSFRLSRPHVITFESIDASLWLKLDESYANILNVASIGEGQVNGNRGEIVKWNISLNPTTPRITMSNRFEVSDVDILPFEPYYDRYSPFVFEKGRFSGTLIFDFDNGSIGSTNEVHISDFRFWIKPGYENAAFWETSVQELAKYFTSPYGEIVFDFKIKGDMSDPKFYLGPISKRALTAMAIDKISTAIENAQSGNSGGGNTDIEKAKEYIDMFKGLINKK